MDLKDTHWCLGDRVVPLKTRFLAAPKPDKNLRSNLASFGSDFFTSAFRFHIYCSKSKLS